MKGTPSERRQSGFRQVNNADEMRDDITIPDGYVTRDARGKEITIVHGHTDKRQVEEIIRAKQEK